MKIVSFSVDDRQSFGVVEGDGVIDVRPIAGEVGATLREALERGTLERVRSWSAGRAADIRFDRLDFLPVIPQPSKILCVGINYHSHVKETGRDVPTHPMIFTRFA